uniref:CSON004896 protein n=1 Tax=Culicoides sonorensis TaxID=179676 RepID=A0A336MVU7_CULSO
MKKLVCLIGLTIIISIVNLTANAETLDTTTVKSQSRINKGFKPKFVKILTQDEINNSNVKSESAPRKFTNRNKIGVGRYGVIKNSPIQMIYQVDEVPIDKVKPIIASEPYIGPKLRPAPGAYPVYYSGANVNGKFGKSIKYYTIREFEKRNLVHT